MDSSSILYVWYLATQLDCKLLKGRYILFPSSTFRYSRTSTDNDHSELLCYFWREKCEFSCESVSVKNLQSKWFQADTGHGAYCILLRVGCYFALRNSVLRAQYQTRVATHTSQEKDFLHSSFCIHLSLRENDKAFRCPRHKHSRPKGITGRLEKWFSM